MLPKDERNVASLRKRACHVIAALERLVPDARCVLRYQNPWELVVAVQLSAQCTDKKVNEVTEKLFRKYRALDDYARADIREFEQDIYATGFYRNKAKNILAAARMVQKAFRGRVPRTMEEMITLPGVARKTANVVLGNAFGIVEGIAVDTHVARLARLLGLSREKTPEKIEHDLMRLVPRDRWFRLTYLLIEYGRRYCPARRHDHTRCPLAGYYATT
ncbi:MAG: endonuclease III [Candidatus Colwellbacteria bacterium]|nr:endonuclease III [Candidatus Colwellbacteria bacterium]